MFKFLNIFLNFIIFSFLLICSNLALADAPVSNVISNSSTATVNSTTNPVVSTTNTNGAAPITTNNPSGATSHAGGAQPVANKVPNKPPIVVGHIVDVQAVNNTPNTLLSFDVTKNFSTQIRIINFPFRLVFDAPMPYDWQVSNKSLNNVELANTVSSIHYGVTDHSTFRVLANLKYPVSINNAFLINSNHDYKLVINYRQSDMIGSLLNTSTIVTPRTKEYYALLQRNNEQNLNNVIDEKRELAINKWINSYLQNTSYPAPKLESANASGYKAVVVIDPGHGGKDPGASPNYNNDIKEKDIVLKIGTRVKDILLQNPQIAVVLTRRGDYFVPLKDRTLWAKNFNADLFVSIHADRAPSPEFSGVSVYTLSSRASDVQSQVIATDQNKSDIIAGLSPDEDSEVSKILINLLQQVKLSSSADLAKSILNSVSESINLLPNPMRSAGFVVLQVPQVPSILIETGFLSNVKDTRYLSNPEYQNLMAEKIASGIINYLLANHKINNLNSN